MQTDRRSFLFSIALIGVISFAPAILAERLPGRYIVELTTEPVSEHVTRLGARAGMQSAVASAHRTLVRAEQQQLRTRLEQQQVVVLDSVDTIANAMFVQVPDADAAQLAAMPGVKRVVPVRMLHMVLDRAVVLHKVSDAWNQIGSDRAGVGIKIAIIDSGIDAGHPGFQDSSLAVPDSFPRVNRSSDVAYTNSKVIVARSYVSLLPYSDPDPSARDRVGHGTALAMVAAGVRNAGPLATITGVAPKAFLGNYKVFGTPGFNDAASDDAILKAMDDAVADGMDIISLSLGDDLAPRLADDLDAQAVERAFEAGVIVVVAAGNNGTDPNTISSPATAPSAIAVGASTNDRTFAASVEVAGLPPFIALTGDASAASTQVTASISDVSALDSSGLACSALPANSLRNRIALIMRGTCTFESKLNNAQNAGAIGGLLFAAEASPDPIHMSVGAASLPAEMISYGDGIAIKQSLASNSSLTGTLRFTLSSVPVSPNRLTDFSAAGPNVDTGIKPDIVAVGSDMYVATQSLDANGDMYNPSGYILVDGTSFSAPLVAGAAALLKSARPGLSANQYRSLLINAAAVPSQSAGVQQVGGGLLDAAAALNSTVTAYPASLSFGAVVTDAQATRTLTLTNAGTSDESYTIASTAGVGARSPEVATNTIQLAPGGSLDIPVVWNASGLTAGPYDGYLIVTGSSGTQARVPYWAAIPSDAPARISILNSITSARRRSTQNDAVLFRITDASGLPLTNVEPQAAAVSGGGAILGIVSHDSEVPGLFGIDARMGSTAGTDVFRIQIGNISLDVSIAAL
jgi:minor extracellular serine protease Vpr